MDTRHPISRRELGLLAALIIPLVILATAVAYIPLKSYFILDPLMFAKRSLIIAHDWGGVTAIKDPPLRYAPLVLIYTIADPIWVVAAAIASAYGAFSVLVVPPLTFWAAARRLTTPRVALLVFAAFYANLLLFPTMLWARPTAGWQYYVVLPWICAILVSTDWTLATTDRHSQRNRAIITGCLLGIAGLTQMLLTLATIAVVVVAYLLRRRVRALIVTGLSGLPFASYYLISTAAREQLIGGVGRKITVESLLPITPKEIAFIALVVVAIALWYRSREELSPVIGAIVLAAGSLWVGAAIRSSAYLSHFFPVLMYPLLVMGLAAGITATLDRYIDSVSSPQSAHVDGGHPAALPWLDRYSWRLLGPALALLTMGLTIALFQFSMRTFPFWRMGG